jgi:hypothetical protein
MNVDEKIELLGDILGADPTDGIDHENLFQVIGDAFERLAARGEDPEDDKWLADRDLFLRVVKPLIVASWGELAGGATKPLPWGDDTLVRAWLEWRIPHAC